MIYNFPPNIGRRTAFRDQQVQATQGYLQLPNRVRSQRNLELRNWLSMAVLLLQGTLELPVYTILRNLGPRGCGVWIEQHEGFEIRLH
jgi:hypothetical protein